MRQDVTLHKKSFHELTTDELYELLRVRSEVFVVEQNCVYQDLDGDDQQSIHLWLTVEDKVVALARVCPAGTHMTEISIGRVITTERGKGYGKQIMRSSQPSGARAMANKSCFMPSMQPWSVSVQHLSISRHRNMQKGSMKAWDSSSRPTPLCSTAFPTSK